MLAHHCGATTIPQIYIGGDHVGGCMDLFDTCSDGSLRRRLAALGVDFDHGADVNPYALLPNWVQPRQSA